MAIGISRMRKARGQKNADRGRPLRLSQARRAALSPRLMMVNRIRAVPVVSEQSPWPYNGHTTTMLGVADDLDALSSS